MVKVLWITFHGDFWERNPGEEDTVLRSQSQRAISDEKVDLGAFYRRTEALGQQWRGLSMLYI